MSGEFLIKLAVNLNVGKDSIVELLKQKGLPLDAKPNPKLNEEQLEIVMREFAGEAKIKTDAAAMRSDKPRNEEITAEQVAARHKKIEREEEMPMFVKETLFKKAEKEKADLVKLEEEKAIAALKVEAIKTEEETVKPQKKTEKKKEEPIPEENDGKKQHVKLSIKGKIELPPTEEEKKEIEKEKRRKTKKEELPVAKPLPVKEKEKKKEIIAEEVVEKIEIKQEEIVESEDKKVIVPNYQKIGGLTILRKIDLPVEEPKKSDIAREERDKKKRKRKRIGGEKIKIPAEAKPGDRPASTSPSTPGSNPRYKGRNPGYERPEISSKEVQDKLKETLSKLNPGSRKPNIGDIRNKFRKQKRDHHSAEREEILHEEELQSKILKVTEFVTANDLARLMNVPVTNIIQTCFSLGMMVSINQRLDAETISIVASEFNYTVEFVSAETQEQILEEVDKTEDLISRPPIVTVMGHVDHGKTSLLDYIRRANVVAGEAGGITQHIGAYEVQLPNGRHITFLDTPGHEAFTAMRARGAKITDVVIIVISADDSVMPQTKEAISHAQAAGVPIVFAINKIDREGANPERIREQLSAMNILVEEWGGKFQSQEISAKKGLNIDLLLEKVCLEADILDLKANPNKRAVGAVIEATLDKGRGIVTTLMVQAGTLKIGDPILAGTFAGKVKAMYNERNQRIQSAGPATPVTILGFSGTPQAGDKFLVTETEQEAKEVANKRMQLLREQGIRTHRHITLDEIGRRLAIGNFKELNLIVKGDVDGSVEALSDSLLKLSTQEIQVNVIYKAVGQISESDVLLASASDAIIIGFNVRPSSSARKIAENEDIDIRLYSIIYDAINEVKAAMEGMLSPTMEEKITCNVEIREVFKITKVGSVAGCYVTDGKITRNSKVRIIRDGVVVYTGELASLKRFKDDAKEVASGYECGLNILNFNDIKVGDVIEGYEQVEVKRKLT